jgi:hypothetical protein
MRGLDGGLDVADRDLFKASTRDRTSFLPYIPIIGLKGQTIGYVRAKTRAGPTEDALVIGLPGH